MMFMAVISVCSENQMNPYIYKPYIRSAMLFNVTVKSTHSYYCPTQGLTAAKNTDLHKS